MEGTLTVGVLGAGTMGAGIVQVTSQAGCKVVACDRSVEAHGALDALVPSGSLILTNTPSISITDLASATGRPEKVCGTHFFTPPPLRRRSRSRAVAHERRDRREGERPDHLLRQAARRGPQGRPRFCWATVSSCQCSVSARRLGRKTGTGFHDHS